MAQNIQEQILELKNKIDLNLINQIIFESDIKNYTNIDLVTKKQINEYFTKCINKITTKPKLFEQFVLENNDHFQTKYHKENLITHLYCVGWICSLFAHKFDLNPEYAFELGFFHDIGKPWAKKYIQTKKKIISNSKGHAQIGENIGLNLGLDTKICWCISNHMCSCCHGNNLSTHWDYVGALQCLSIQNSLEFIGSDLDLDSNQKYLDYGASLACLMIGDDLGRSGDIEKNITNIIAHSESWFEWFKNYIKQNNFIKHSVNLLSTLHPDNSIIIQMYGHSGFGKSTGCAKLIKQLDKFGITYEYAERDKSYYNVYSEMTGISLDIVINTINYSTIYNYIESNDLKKQVQCDWIKQLNSILDSNSKVKIIDSVQLAYPKAWESTLTSLNPDAYAVWNGSLKIGYYGFPQSLYEHEFIPKTGKFELIPRDITDGFTWPNMNFELSLDQEFNPELIDVAYGSIESIINTIQNYNLWSKLYTPEKQIHLIQLLDQIDKKKLTSNYIQKFIIQQFPPGIINSSIELNSNSINLIKFGYRDGMQIFNGISRDYRGETLLFDSSTLNYYIGRVSLPVFPDYNDIRKDPQAQELITTSTKFHIIPKFDGSLFVLALIKTDNPGFTLIKKLLPLVSSQAYKETELGIWCIGSKSNMFAKNQYGDTGVLNRITKSIRTSYGTIDNFIHQVSIELKQQKILEYSNISMVFESVDSSPTPELTVEYSKSSCPFLCWIVWDEIENKKKIILPHNINYLNPVATITTVDTWDQVIEFKNLAHLRLLEGSESDEPEGYVVWLDNSNIGIKLKHPEYYAAHKPYSKSNAILAKRIEFESEYSKLRPRLLKFKQKPPIEDIILNKLELINEIFLDSFVQLSSKKTWVLHWKIISNVSELNKILNIMEAELIAFYPQFAGCFKDKGFGVAMDYFDKRDSWKKYLFEKYLKIPFYL